MISILGGFVAAICFATTALTSTRATRLIGVGPAIAWVMLVGLAVALPAVLITAPNPVLTPDTTALLAIAGFGNVLGLGFQYAGLRAGQVGVVIPIVSTEGALAAVIAVGAGEEVAPVAAIALAVVVLGVVLVALRRGPDDSPLDATNAPHLRRRTGIAAAFGLGAAILFGISAYATGRISAELPLAWAVLPPRAVGVVVVAIPLILAGRLRISRAAAPFLVVGGLAEVAGFTAFAVGARDGISITAVLASQFGAVAAIAAYLLFGERLSRVQRAGVVTIAVGVAVLAAARA